MKPNMNTPWGHADEAIVIAPGITKYYTPSHGGYLLSPERRSQMPAHLRDVPTFAGSNWYEEDCDWALVALSFPEHFAPEVMDAAGKTLAWMKINSPRFKD